MTETRQFIDANSRTVEVLQFGASNDYADAASTTALTYDAVFRLVALADARVAITESTAAAATDTLLPEAAIEYVKVKAGLKIHVKDGPVNITQVS